MTRKKKYTEDEADDAADNDNSVDDTSASKSKKKGKDKPSRSKKRVSEEDDESGGILDIDDILGDTSSSTTSASSAIADKEDNNNDNETNDANNEDSGMELEQRQTKKSAAAKKKKGKKAGRVSAAGDEDAMAEDDNSSSSSSSLRLYDDENQLPIGHPDRKLSEAEEEAAVASWDEQNYGDSEDERHMALISSDIQREEIMFERAGIRERVARRAKYRPKLKLKDKSNAQQEEEQQDTGEQQEENEGDEDAMQEDKKSSKKRQRLQPAKVDKEKSSKSAAMAVSENESLSLDYVSKSRVKQKTDVEKSLAAIGKRHRSDTGELIEEGELEEEEEHEEDEEYDDDDDDDDRTTKRRKKSVTGRRRGADDDDEEGIASGVLAKAIEGGEEDDKNDEISSERKSSIEGATIKLTLAHIRNIQLRRTTLEQLFDKPYFEKFIVHMFVRVFIGNKKDGSAAYRLCEVIKLDDVKNKYKFLDKEITKGLLCQHGKEQRIFQLMNISNEKIKEDEFDVWKRQMESDKLNILSGNEANRRRKNATNLHNTFKFTEDIAEELFLNKLKEFTTKGNNSTTGMNYTTMKTQLTIELESAELQENKALADELKKIMEKITEKEKNDRNKKKRLEEEKKNSDTRMMVDIEVLRKINDRQRYALQLQKLNSLGNSSINVSAVITPGKEELDPFKRKSTQINTAQDISAGDSADNARKQLKQQEIEEKKKLDAKLKALAEAEKQARLKKADRLNEELDIKEILPENTLEASSASASSSISSSVSTNGLLNGHSHPSIRDITLPKLKCYSDLACESLRRLHQYAAETEKLSFERSAIDAILSAPKWEQKQLLPTVANSSLVTPRHRGPVVSLNHYVDLLRQDQQASGQ